MRSKWLMLLSFLLASSNAFAGGGGGESGPLLSDEDWGTLCSYTGYAILAVLALFAFGKFVAWVTAPCRETYRRARIWRDAMDALPPARVHQHGGLISLFLFLTNAWWRQS